MGDVPNTAMIGAWRVVTNIQTLKRPAQLKLDRPLGTLSGAGQDRITEVFVRDNLSQQTEVVGTFVGTSELVLDDFGDLLSRQGKLDVTRSDTDLTYFAYSASKTDYDKTCTSEGGEIVEPQNYCSFANKKIIPSTSSLQNIDSLSRQGVKTQSLNGISVVSWNLGNVAQSCGTSTGGANYNYKLCYVSTERRISDTILSFEQSQKPAVIFFQEIWHGDCRYTPESSYGTYTNQRLCASNVPNNFQNTMTRILGISRYYSSCTQTEDVPADQLVVNGYECIAIDPNVLTPNYNHPASAGNTTDGYHPPCDINNQDPTHNFPGRDTGYMYMNVTPVNSTTNLMLVSSHLVAVTDSACRTEQLTKLKGFAPLYSQSFSLLGGDFNTNPNAANDPAAITFRNVFSGTWGAPSGYVASEIDDPNQATAFYVNGNQNLDHVLGRNFGGSCQRGGSFDGTDHTWTRCTISSPLL